MRVTIFLFLLISSFTSSFASAYEPVNECGQTEKEADRSGTWCAQINADGSVDLSVFDAEGNPYTYLSGISAEEFLAENTLVEGDEGVVK